MGATVDVTIPIDTQAARVLDSPARREAAGRYLSRLLNGENIPDVLAEAISEAKREAHGNGLTNGDVDAELEAWRAEKGR